MSSQPPFDSTCQNDATDRVKLFVDKRKFVLSNSLSDNKQRQQKLEQNGNMYNGKLYDENNLRTVKIDQKKLQCEVKNSSEGESNDSISSATPVMTCGANVVANVKEALVCDVGCKIESKKVSETPDILSKNETKGEKDLLPSATKER